MKQLCTKTILGLILCTGGAAISQAQEMTAEKRASTDPSDIIKPTATVSMRNCVEQLPSGMGANKQFLETRTIFGANILKDKYVVTLESRYQNPLNSAKVSNTVNYFTATPKSFKIGLLSLGGYFQEVMLDKQPTIDVIALNAELAKETETSVGTFKGQAYVEGDYMVSGQPSKAKYKSRGPNDNGLQLAKATQDDKTGTWQGEKHKPDLYTEFDQIGTYTPSFDKNWSLMVTNYMRSNYTEEVTVDEAGSQVSSTYAQANSVETVFTLAYKLSDRLTLANDTGVRRDGFWGKRSSSLSMENYYTLIRLDATLL